MEVPLHAIHADGERIFEREVPRVFRQDRCVVSAKSKIVAHEYSQADCACEPKSLVVCIPNSNRKSTSIETGFRCNEVRLALSRRNERILASAFESKNQIPNYR